MFARPRPIGENDYVAEFRCGEEVLDQFLSERAVKNELAGASRTFVSLEIESGRVAGYFCLSASTVVRAEATTSLRRNMPDPVPVILIGRLAVDGTFAGRGLGASLLQEAALKAVEASRIIGARAVVVVAMSATAEQFSRKFGFRPLPDDSRTLYVTMTDAEATISQIASGGV